MIINSNYTTGTQVAVSGISKMICRIFICTLLLFAVLLCHAQQSKPPLDTASLGTWPGLAANAVSNDGNYVSYTITQKGKPTTMYLQQTDKGWKLPVPGGKKFQFIDEYRQAVFQKSNDTLCLFSLKSKSAVNITGISSYELIRHRGKPYLYMRNRKNDLLIRDLHSGKENVFAAVAGYEVSKDGGNIVLTFPDAKGQRIVWYELLTQREHAVWIGKGASGICFDPQGTQLAFMVKDSAKGRDVYRIFHYKKGNDQASKVWDTDRPGYEAMSISVTGFRFSAEGGRLFFTGSKKKEKAASKVTIWSYNDPYLQSQYAAKYPLKQISNPADVMLMFNIANKQIIRLINEGEFLENTDTADRYMIITKETGNENEASWMPSARQSVYLLNMYTGERKAVKENATTWLDNLVMEPGGKFLLYFDKTQQNYFSMNTTTGEVLNLTGKLNEQWGSYAEEKEAEQGGWIVGNYGWLKDEPVTLINGRYNLWKIDVSGKVQPVNLTKSVNPDNRLVFNPAFLSTLYNSKSMYLLAFNRGNKQQGIYYVDLDEKNKPEKLSAGSYLYDNLYMPYRKMGETTSVNGRYYIVKRGNTTTYPNLYLTKDFRNFRQVTGLHPEQNYNWMTAELHTFKSLDNIDTKGILYKPENFDPKKKYPLIFLCYETLSDRLNFYLTPKHSNGPIEVSYLVSNGYLVFLSDVNFTHEGMTGRSFYNAVMGASEYLESIPYVDNSKMGLQGHSFGAFGINYIITHTSKFAAALSASGSSNMITMNTALWERTGNSKMNYSQYRFEKTLWEQPDLYLENSIIMKADKITTPLLLMANKGDTQVPYTENRALFISLRRLRKPVWMLEYNGEGHTVLDKENSINYEFKSLQFFDHYLKGKSISEWLPIVPKYTELNYKDQ